MPTTVTVLRVYQGLPGVRGPLPEQGTIDMTVGTKYERKAFPMSGLTSASAVQSVLTANSEMLLNFDHNGAQDTPFAAPPYGTVRDDLIPVSFDI